MLKLYKQLVLVLVLITFIGCNEDSPTEPLYTNFTESYFPLHIGNEWQYESTRDDSTYFYYRISGKETIANKEYFVIIDNFYGLDTNYIRSDNGVQYYIYKENRDMPYRDFRNITLIKDTYNNQNIDCKIELNSINVIKTKAGEFKDYAAVEEGNTSLDGGTMYYYVKGIGLINSWWFIGKIDLVYSKVNGVETGEKLK